MGGSASNVIALPGVTAPGAEPRPIVKKRLPCTFEGCGRQRHAKKLCDGHYQQLLKTGTTWPLSATRSRKPSFVSLTSLPCSFAGCKNKRACGDWCHGHNYQLRHGKPLAPLWQHAKLSVCRVCKDPKKPRTSEFFRVALNVTGLSGTCRECAQRKTLREILRKHGVDESWYDRTLAAQGGRCAICGTSNPGRKRRFKIDHDHATAEVRGLLCHHCNVGIGLLGDSPLTLRAAVGYLERNGK